MTRQSASQGVQEKMGENTWIFEAQKSSREWINHNHQNFSVSEPQGGDIEKARVPPARRPPRIEVENRRVARKCKQLEKNAIPSRYDDRGNPESQTQNLQSYPNLDWLKNSEGTSTKIKSPEKFQGGVAQTLARAEAKLKECIARRSLYKDKLIIERRVIEPQKDENCPVYQCMPPPTSYPAMDVPRNETEMCNNEGIRPRTYDQAKPNFEDTESELTDLIPNFDSVPETVPEAPEFYEDAHDGNPRPMSLAKFCRITREMVNRSLQSPEKCNAMAQNGHGAETAVVPRPVTTAQPKSPSVQQAAGPTDGPPCTTTVRSLLKVMAPGPLPGQGFNNSGHPGKIFCQTRLFTRQLRTVNRGEGCKRMENSKIDPTFPAGDSRGKGLKSGRF